MEADFVRFAPRLTLQPLLNTNGFVPLPGFTVPGQFPVQVSVVVRKPPKVVVARPDSPAKEPVTVNAAVCPAPEFIVMVDPDMAVASPLIVNDPVFEIVCANVALQPEAITEEPAPVPGVKIPGHVPVHVSVAVPLGTDPSRVVVARPDRPARDPLTVNPTEKLLPEVRVITDPV
jgi:hypothetical protein